MKRSPLILGLTVLALGVGLSVAGRGAHAAPTPQLSIQPFTSGYGDLTFVTAPPNDPNLYVVERTGRVWVVGSNGVRRPTPFLDVTPLMGLNGDQGLLSIAFNPQYSLNRLLDIFYVDKANHIKVAEYRSDGQRVMPSSGRVILDIADPIYNHYGGQLAFGPDRKLYASVGDGGCCADPLNAGQSLTTRLGKILRATVSSSPFLPGPPPQWEIWGYGVRNPWRFSFDRQLGDFYLGEVGQDAWEEIDYRPRNAGQANFGWARFEGNHLYRSDVTLGGTAPLVFPMLEYPHSQGCSVIGGYVYRGPTVTNAKGRYFYGDFCTGQVWSAKVTAGVASDNRAEPFNVPLLSSFGEDYRGDLYLVSLLGTVYKLGA